MRITKCVARAGVTFLLALGAVRGAVGAEALCIARRGEAAPRAIVLPAQASESQRTAAEELRDYVKRMTGVTLPVRSDAEALPSRAVLIGETRHTAKALGGPADVKALGDDGFRLVAKAPHLLVLGSRARGCLYGVYELLEKYGGCRWYASWHTVVPKCASFTVPGGLDVVQKPDFVMRTSWWCDVNTHEDFAAHLRLNSRPWGAMGAKYGGDAFRFCRTLQSCHTFDFLLPPSKYRKDHPEYFSSKGGSRTQPCLTNPEVLAIVTSNVLEQVRRDPDALAYGVSQNDWYNYCTCPRCKAVDDEEGSHAGTMVRFVNAVAEAVERKYPGKIIETLAYQYTRRPPTKTKLRHNVVPCLCSIECDFGRPIPESPYHQNKSFMNDIVGWSRMTDQLYVWDYVTNFRHFAYPLPNCYALQGNLKFFRDNKVKEMFPEGDYKGNLADFDTLKAWLLAKWQWNADLPMKDLLDDFFAGYYGKAAPFVRTYFEELHRIHCADPAQPRLIYESVTSPALPDKFLVRAAGLFEQALDAVKGEPAVFARNVRGTAFSVDYTRFMRLERKTGSLLRFSRDAPDARLEREVTALARRMLAVMEEFKPVCLSEGRREDDREKELVRAAAARQPGAAADRPALTRGCVEEKDLAYCHPDSMGRLVDDPKAEDGRALKLFNTHYEWSTQMSFARIATDPGQWLRLRVRCRVEKTAEPRKGEAFWTGVYDHFRRKGVCELDAAVEKIPDEDYHWYDVGTFAPCDTQVFWIGPGRFGKDGKSNIGALYVDKIELSLAAPASLKFANGTVGTYQTPVAAGDFGTDAFGWLEVRSKTPGPCVLRIGEQRGADGAVNVRPAGTVRGCEVRCTAGLDWTRVPLVADKRNTRCTGDGAVAVALPPKVGVVMPFRYVQKVSGPDDLEMRRVFVHWPMERKAKCPTNDRSLRELWDFCQHTMVATSFAGIMVDGDRERIPYEGDIYINMMGQLYGVDGDPELARRSIRHVLKHPTWPTEWKQHAIMCVWEDWRFTGSTALAAECYDLLKRDKLMTNRARPDGLLPADKNDIVDWPRSERDGYDMKTPCNAVVNAFYYRNLREMADLAKALGKAADAQAFLSDAELVRQRFNVVFYDSKTGLYVDGEGSRHASLHANVAALDFGLVPKKRQPAVVAFIAGRGMACSPYFAQYYLEALCKYGRKDVARRLMTARGDRSWLGMIDQGATMTMEAWSLKAKPNQDWNHAWGAAPLNIIARYFGGSKPSPTR